MITEIFDFMYNLLYANIYLSIAGSFLWGMASILLSPCHLSAIPLMVGFITSQGKQGVKNAFMVSLIFSAGILITTAIIGIITASLGRILGDIGNIGIYFVAIILFFTSFYLLDIIKPNWNFFRIRIAENRKKGY